MSIFSWLEPLIAIIKKKVTRRARNRKWLTFSYSFRQIASNLSSFFLPLFLFEIAQTIEVSRFNFTPIQKGMVLISAYYLSARLVMALFSLIQANITLKIGHRRSMMAGILLYALFLMSLTYASDQPLFLFAGAFFSGLYTVFFWQSYNTLMSRFALKTEMGRSLGLLQFFNNLIAMLSPAIGALIISFFGFNYLFYASILIVLIALIGILQLDLRQEKDEVNLKEYLTWLKERRFNRLMLSQAGRYFNDASLVLWPLYVFLLLDDIKRVGYIYSLSLFLAMIINLFVGNVLDKKRKSRLPFFMSGSFLSGLWFVKAMVISAWGVVIVDSLDRIVGSFHWLFHETAMFNRGRGSQDFSYFVYRLTNHSIAAAIFWLLLLAFFLIVPLEWNGLFALGAVGVLLSLLVKENKRAGGVSDE